MKTVLFIHYLLQSFRHLFVLSGFGTISYCKHTPTCSEYSLESIKKNGYVKGVLQGTWKVLQCW